ncbi:unnamed protein product [Adineta ricciae]|uniref:Uncharacterized protein n=1 Tax=Adineta ricciae TaxID=249248 RepID=A0A813XU49_ADIRI|nr:unnamed protein product [Adineta ricciae]
MTVEATIKENPIIQFESRSKAKGITETAWQRLARVLSVIDLDTVRAWLQDVAKHVSFALSTSTITAVFVFGGISSGPNQGTLQEHILKIIQTDANDGGINQGSYTQGRNTKIQ